MFDELQRMVLPWLLVRLILSRGAAGKKGKTSPSRIDDPNGAKTLRSGLTVDPDIPGAALLHISGQPPPRKSFACAGRQPCRQDRHSVPEKRGV